MVVAAARAELVTQLEQLLAENVMLDVEESDGPTVSSNSTHQRPILHKAAPQRRNTADNWDDSSNDSNNEVISAAGDEETDSLLWNEASSGGSSNWDGEDGRLNRVTAPTTLRRTCCGRSNRAL